MARPGIFETSFETDSGSARTIIDFMPVPEADGRIELISPDSGNPGRRAHAHRGHPAFASTVAVSHGCGGVSAGLNAISGPHAGWLSSPVPLRGTPEFTTIGEFEVAAGEITHYSMSWSSFARGRRSFHLSRSGRRSTINRELVGATIRRHFAHSAVRGAKQLYARS